MSYNPLKRGAHSTLFVSGVNLFLKFLSSPVEAETRISTGFTSHQGRRCFDFPAEADAHSTDINFRVNGFYNKMTEL
ncbi:hypothetical protein CA267_009560 [Alteromonas pelagimontana]|uniref:Uncharacterized protein n=1 Tax=Alteromonas pelagimontana TaxID=1858656 RepID=A0A6M4MDU3_9ALTE|nr:hypothetical protein [Alteromonas pelagimontana]QJR81008.1 hypothetical protein CA267_009560 [Alteromonas pelagimontana]